MRFHLFFNRERMWQIFLALNVTFTLLFTSFLSVNASNDWVDTSLRVDLPAVYQADDYIHTIWIGGTPGTGSNYDFTDAYLSVYLAQYNGQLYSGLFSQVGFITDRTGVKWFVYSEAGVQCLQGNPAWGTMGCTGNYGDRASVGHWQNVELVTYGQGFWIARVYDQYGNALDVAKFWSNSRTIYKADVATEEGYPEATDPYMLASFWHNHPKYMVWGTGFTDWPASSGGQTNNLYVYPSSICPNHYIARLNWFGNDPRVWYAGSSGPTPVSCSAYPIF